MFRGRADADRLNIGTKDETEVTGYKPDNVKLALTIFVTILTGGLLLILITWKPSIKLGLTQKRCPLKEAKKLLLRDIYHQQWEENVQEEDVPDKEEKSNIRVLYFMHKKIKYKWDDVTCTFIRLRPFEEGSTFSSFCQKDKGLTSGEVANKRSLFGENFMKIEILSIWQLLVQQAVNPFYIFQLFTVILWCLQEYFLFAGCILALSAISISVMVFETRKQSRALRERITTESDVTVLRDEERCRISSKNVVPGDILLLREDTVGHLEADAILLGGSVIVNEAMLTGESIPVTKVAIPPSSDTMFSEEEHKHHMLYSGTEILQVRGGKELMAVVVKTGFYTSRGEFVRSILFPKPIASHFYADFMNMLFLFILLGLAAMSWSLYHLYSVEDSLLHTILNSLDLVTFVVPPLLPATITAINVGALLRLKRHNIFCLSSNYISLLGSIDVVCFDKTGTLTENDLDLAGVIPSQNGDLQKPQDDLQKLRPDLPLAMALATCHSLSKIDGRLAGYPLDVKIFSGIGWTLIEPEPVINQDYGMIVPLLVQPAATEWVDSEQQEVAIMKTFPFKSKEQRATVVTKQKVANHFDVFIKGAPEMIASLCNQNTVPGLMDSALEWYTRQGLRVVAVAHASLPSSFTWDKIENSSREELEDGADFLGMVLLQNKVKPKTPSVISTLHHANIQTVMITGDNLLTAVSVARQSGLLQKNQQLIVVEAQMVSTTAIAAQHLQVKYYDVEQIDALYDKRKMISVRNKNYALAMDGHTFELIQRGQDKDLYQRIVKKGKIFARMKPDQKTSVIEAFQDIGHQVAMCGDGCNDCGALKAANAGISLSSSEASVAAPFTSKEEDIGSVPTLIREGRAALVSIFLAFEYDVCMCFGALICVLFQFKIYTMPSDAQYSMMDVVLGAIPALIIGNTGAPSTLVPSRPTQRILSILPALSMLSFLGIQALTYWIVLTYIRSQPWFEPFFYTGEIYPPQPSHENTALILVNFHSFYVGVLVFSHALPFRRQIYTNYLLFGYLICSVFLCLFMTFYTGDWMINFLNFCPFPDLNTPGMIFFIISISCLISFVWERWILYGLLGHYVLPWFKKTCGPDEPYVKLEKQLEKQLSEWPPLSDPVQLEAPVAMSKSQSIAGGPLKEKDSINSYNDDDDPNNEAFLIRKLTTRHRFRASVHVKKGPPVSEIPSAPPPNSPDEVSPSPMFNATTVRDGYQVPCDNQSDGNTVFKFNQSIRKQIMKGTGGIFSTFRGNAATKRNSPQDEASAEAYEIVNLQDNYQDNGEAIYATIDEMPGSYVEDIERGERSSPNNALTRNNNGESFYDENETNNRALDGATGVQQAIYDVPSHPPKSLQEQEVEENLDMQDFPRKLVPKLSYIDDDTLAEKH